MQKDLNLPDDVVYRYIDQSGQLRKENVAAYLGQHGGDGLFKLLYNAQPANVGEKPYGQYYSERYTDYDQNFEKDSQGTLEWHYRVTPHSLRQVLEETGGTSSLRIFPWTADLTSAKIFLFKQKARRHGSRGHHIRHHSRSKNNQRQEHYPKSLTGGRELVVEVAVFSGIHNSVIGRSTGAYLSAVARSSLSRCL